ncbi:MAG: hypothetical protein J5636_09720 [Clostridiales bacterium]|nr:hypothetical protein [Clostridiales bacterium]
MESEREGSRLSFEEYLAEFGKLTYRNVGTSMLPLIKQNRDAFTVRRLEPGEMPKPKDVVLFRRRAASGEMKYVLHRVWKKSGDMYVCIGDNCVNAEKNVRLEDIMGILTEVNRKGRIVRMTDRSYRIYVWFWCVTRPVRIFFKKAWLLAKKLGKKILRRG